MRRIYVIVTLSGKEVFEMVEIVENPVMMTYEEMESEYDGKWVYAVNCELTPGDRLISGTPVIVADMQYEGVDTGIYDRYDTDEYGVKCAKDFLDTSFYLVRSISLG